MTQFFVSLLCLASILMADPIPSFGIPCLENDPQTIVDGKICITTGQYVEFHTDLSVPSLFPIELRRGFFMIEGQNDQVHEGFQFATPDPGFVYQSTSDTRATAFFKDSNGTTLGYGFDLKDRGGHFYTSTARGIANTGRGPISGRTNLKNYKIVYRPKHRHDFKGCQFRVHTSHGEEILFDQFCLDSLRSMYKATHRTNACGAKHKYTHKKRESFKYDTPPMLCSTKAYAPDGSSMGEITYDFPVTKREMRERPHGSAHTSTGMHIEYDFKMETYESKKGKEKWFGLLTKVSGPGTVTTRYHYTKGCVTNHIECRENSKRLLCRVEYPNDRFLRIANISNRVDAIYEPLDTKEEVLTYKVGYKLKDDKITKAFVARPNRFLAEYAIGDEQRIDSVTFYDTGIKKPVLKTDNPPCLTFHYLWGEPESSKRGNLMTKYLKDFKNKILIEHTFEYDYLGNVVLEKYRGNLLGRLPNRSVWTGVPLPKTLEERSHFHFPCSHLYEKKYTYDEYSNKTSETFPNRVRIEYTYLTVDGKTLPLVTSKITKGPQQQILAREFFHYAPSTALIGHVRDDGGSSLQLSNTRKHLFGVHLRKRTRYTPITTEENFGFPARAIEYGWDEHEKKEVTLGGKEFIYDAMGRRCCEKVLDSTQTVRYETRCEYNMMGKVVWEVDPLGHEVVREYDELGNMTREDHLSSGYQVLYEYNYRNLVSKKTEKWRDYEYTTRYGYTHRGACKKLTDPYDNVTEYGYDMFGNVNQTIYPAHEYPDETFWRTVEEKEYDVMGNMLMESLPEPYDPHHQTPHYKTYHQYNMFGKVIETVHDSGEKETFEYNYDGLLFLHTSPTGFTTKYAYDYTGKVLEKLYCSGTTGESYSEKFCYMGELLKHSTDRLGNMTYYQYDAAGRCTWIKEGPKKTKYAYDALGFLCQTEHFDGEELLYRVCQRNDVLGREVESWREDGEGNVRDRTYTQYDVFGNVCETTTSSGTVRMEYDPWKRLISSTDLEGRQTHYTYLTYTNAYGQKGCLRKCSHPDGRISYTYYDSRNRVVQEEEVSSSHIVASRVKIYYDARGNVGRRKQYVFNRDLSLTPLEQESDPGAMILDRACFEEQNVHYTYNHRNVLVSMCERQGTAHERMTTYATNDLGQRTAMTHPDGKELYYTYDDMNRMIKMRSSDQTIDQEFVYDAEGRMICGKDLLDQTETVRAFDRFGNMVREELANGLHITYNYDTLSRIRDVYFSDHSQVHYTYCLWGIREVTRTRPDGSLAYCHRYESFDEASNPREETLIDGTTRIRSHDVFNRIRTIEHPCFSLQGLEYDLRGNLIQAVQKDSLGTLERFYTYDTLGQLESEKGAVSHRYRHDSVHGRVVRDEESHDLNPLNQVTRHGDTSLSYDLQGNTHSIQTPGTSQTFTYDALGRLIRLTTSEANIEYTYDVFHRRVASSDGRRYIWMGDNEVGSYVDDHVADFRVLGIGFGQEVGATVAIEIEGKTFAAHFDQSGHIMCLSHGDFSESYRYGAFGEKVAGGDLSPWLISSKRFDSASGFSYFGRRYYMPLEGRWLTPDPLSYEEAWNLYSYVGNHPLTGLDIQGLCELECIPHIDDPDAGFRSFKRHCSSAVSHSVRSIQSTTYETKFFSKDYLTFNKPTPQWYSIGGNTMENSRICYINGMYTSFEEATQNAKYLSNILGGYQVDYLYNPTYGAWRDFGRAVDELLLFFNKPVVEQYIQHTTSYLNENPNDRIFQVVHSEGGIILRNAVSYMEKEARSRIFATSVAPGGYTNPANIGSIMHLISENDFVPLFDQYGKHYYAETIQIVETSSVYFFSLESHSFRNPIYQDKIIANFKKFQEDQ